MYSFLMNGYLWSVVFVNEHSPKLIDQTNTHRVATTDPEDLCIYLSSALGGDFLLKVLKHELAHCVIFSYNLIRDIHYYTHKDLWIEAEESVCNFIANYGDEIIFLAKDIQKNLARR